MKSEDSTLPTEKIVAIDNTVKQDPAQRFIPISCFLCETELKHTDVILLGLSSDDKDIAMHPRCLRPEHIVKLKVINQVNVHLEEGKAVSSAKAFIIKKHLKKIYKEAAIANEIKKQKKQN